VNTSGAGRFRLLPMQPPYMQVCTHRTPGHNLTFPGSRGRSDHHERSAKPAKLPLAHAQRVPETGKVAASDDHERSAGLRVQN
jgi:hypothetical protein